MTVEHVPFCLLRPDHDGPCRNIPDMDSQPSISHLASAARQATKDTNPKDAVGVRKARWFSYIPLQVMVGVGLALLEGARKYGRHNYRKAGVRASVYMDATVCGHLTPWFEGEDIDPVSGLNHVDKAIASLIVLRDGMLQGNWVDDRPLKAKGLNLAEADKKAIAIIEAFPDAKQPFTEVEHGEGK